ncbi:MAG: kelch repeat-containing protein [Planctomycetota bacterium]
MKRRALGTLFIAGLIAGCSGGGGGRGGAGSASTTAPATTQNNGTPVTPAPINTRTPAPVTTSTPAPVTSSTPPVVATPPAAVVTPTIALASFVDKDGNGLPSMGDEVTVAFTATVTLGATPLASRELVLKRPGDSFGTGATIAATATATTVVVKLGADPVLRLTGTYVLGNNASGVDVNPLGTLKANGAAANGGVDFTTTLRPGFRTAPSLLTPRGYHTATLLGDGRVLVVGGFRTTSKQAPVTAAKPSVIVESELYDPAANAWIPASAPSVGGPIRGYMMFKEGTKNRPSGRALHTATLLLDGRVLIAGGYGYEDLDKKGHPVVADLKSAYIFNPRTNSFAKTDSLEVARHGHMAVLLPSGDVLVAGGYSNKEDAPIASAELFDVQTGKWKTLAANADLLRRRFHAVATPIAGGLMVTGGRDQTGQNVRVAENFIETAQKFTSGATMVESRRLHSATTFASGNVLVAGGDTFGTTKSVEKYIAATKTFTKVGDLKEARCLHAAARIAGSTDVVFVGGSQQAAGSKTVKHLATGEWWDGTTNVSELYQMAHDRAGSQATPLLNGRVLVTGGFTGGVKTLDGRDGVALRACEFFQVP